MSHLYLYLRTLPHQQVKAETILANWFRLMVKFYFIQAHWKRLHVFNPYPAKVENMVSS